MLEGYKTKIGLATIFVGWLGLGTVITNDQVGTLIDLGSQLIGLLIAIYGNYDKQKRLDDVKK